ncbi:MAG: nucleotidyltransferase domain-containing protein [Methylibium sp.]|nr:nucleotidyltransferase domain-containing protein [Methylibium sp.]
MDNTVKADPEHLAKVCRRYGISRLALFGSRLKGAARSDSDVDLLVEFEPGATPGLLRMAEIEEKLSPLFGGHTIDLRTAEDLSRHFRDQVVAHAEVQYAQ